jgi:hypothetical protein
MVPGRQTKSATDSAVRARGYPMLAGLLSPRTTARANLRIAARCSSGLFEKSNGGRMSATFEGRVVLSRQCCLGPNASFRAGHFESRPSLWRNGLTVHFDRSFHQAPQGPNEEPHGIFSPHLLERASCVRGPTPVKKKAQSTGGSLRSYRRRAATTVNSASSRRSYALSDAALVTVVLSAAPSRPHPRARSGACSSPRPSPRPFENLLSTYGRSRI